jgi:hypothetical protein
VTPRVSVVMPVRNAERFVAEALRSVLDQTLRDLELVVVDDGSSDRTGDILRELAAHDERVRIQPARGDGLVPALNEGCALATAPLLARMDADDVAEPARLARQVEAMDADPTLLLLGTAVTQIDDRGTAFATVMYPADPGDELLRRNCFAHPTVVIRRDPFDHAGGYRDVFPHAEDYDLWLRLAELGRVANLQEPLLRYRVHPGQVTRRQIEEQAVATLSAQAAARARRAGGVEPARGELKPPVRAVRRRVFAATVELAASRLDAGGIDEAASLLRDAWRQLAEASWTSRLVFLTQLARLGRRRFGQARWRRKSPRQ